ADLREHRTSVGQGVPVLRTEPAEERRRVHRVEDEAPAGTERTRDGREEPLVLVLRVEVAERAEDVDRGVELRLPGQVAHVAAHELDVQAGRVATRGLERRLGEVDTRDAVAAPRQLDGVAAVTARDVEDPRAAL